MLTRILTGIRRVMAMPHPAPKSDNEARFRRALIEIAVYYVKHRRAADPKVMAMIATDAITKGEA